MSDNKQRFDFFKAVEDAKKKVSEITISDLQRSLDNGAALIDVREDHELLAGRHG